MPRFVRSRRSPVRKRQTKWCGIATSLTTPNPANATTADGIQLCTVTTAAPDQADPVVGWCRGNISITRSNTSDTTMSCAWAIVLMRLVEGDTLPVQVFSPFLTGDLERQDILGYGHIEVPPTVLTPSTDARTPDRSSRVAEINLRVGRKLARNTNNLFLWIMTSGSDNGLSAEVDVRTLMKFG